MKDVLFVLGADDPEMREIERILNNAALPYVYAKAEGRRCHPGNAYEARNQLSSAADVVFVECKVVGVTPVKTIDHHNEGDPGYGLGPTHYLKASSLGQLIGFLQELGHKITITQDMRVLAAMDHCRQAAILGKCPGVSAKEVISRRVTEIAAAADKEVREVQSLIDSYRGILAKQENQPFGDSTVIDLTEAYLGEGYSLKLLSAQTALDIAGVAALLRHADKPGGPEKITLSGHVSPKMVQHFLKVYAPEKGLKKTYGVPARGYAGGYLS
ncbi:MAG TPA: hypothetical protein VD907_03990 [Verrucomicrobiae bacterium]|nr:hypothetical protein [Verrucomicrobiae bacterium]